MPRQMLAGPVLLDLFHRDARLHDTWLHLHPREFGLLWRLAESPRVRLSRQTLLRDVWRLHHEPETNTVEVHIYRLRRKLLAFGIDRLVITEPTGGYRLEAEVVPVMLQPEHVEILDSQPPIRNATATESQPG